MARQASTFDGEADFNGHLPLLHTPFADAATRFDHLEPA